MTVSELSTVISTTPWNCSLPVEQPVNSSSTTPVREPLATKLIRSIRGSLER